VKYTLPLVLSLLAACSDAATNDLPDDTPNQDKAAQKNDAGRATDDESDKEEEKKEETPPPAEEKPADVDIDTIAWSTGADVGFGVASKDTGNAAGNNAALFYGGNGASLANVEGWATALYKADLKARGVRWLYAIQGPDNATYSHYEIGNSKLATMLHDKVDDKTKFILVLGHSSGSYVAHEFLGQVASKYDPDGKMDKRIAYFNLDGTDSRFTIQMAGKVNSTYWVSPKDVTKNTEGLNADDMAEGANGYPDLGSLITHDASQAGCNAGARACVNSTLVTSKPHDPAKATPTDYDDFSGGRTVTTKYLTDKATEAGLVP